MRDASLHESAPLEGLDPAVRLLAEYRTKCREIHALQALLRAGRLDEQRWSAVDWRLRAEAIGLLGRLEGLRQ